VRGNWIQMSATSASANSNPTTLSAVTNYPTFADVLGSSGTIMVEYDFDDGNGHKELGQGVLNLSTLSLTRTALVTYDTGATPKYVAVAPSALTSFSGTVTVKCALAAENFSSAPSLFLVGGSAPGVPGVGNGFFSSSGSAAAVFTMSAATCYVVPFKWRLRLPIKRASMQVSTAGTSPCPIRMAIYIPQPNQTTADLLIEFTASTQFDGTVVSAQSLTAPTNFSAVNVPCQDFFVAIGCSGANGCTVKAENNSWLQEMGGMLGFYSSQLYSANGMFRISGSFSTFPSQLTSSNTTLLTYAYSNSIILNFGSQ
jgi:hypothetical protein